MSLGSFSYISVRERGRLQESFAQTWEEAAKSGESPITSTARGSSRPDRSSFTNLLRDEFRGAGGLRHRNASKPRAGAGGEGDALKAPRSPPGPRAVNLSEGRWNPTPDSRFAALR